MCAAAIIRQLSIERFRGIKEVEWKPSEGVNLLLGGGDIGKTTVLDAIALLLSPTNSFTLSEADYWQKKSDDGFLIRAFVSLPASTDINQQRALNWPWEWNGEEALVPALDGGDGDLFDTTDAVYCLQARGTPELELVWEIVQPNDDLVPLSASLRRLIGIVKLSGEERNDRDLRLVYGSALDRLLADQGLRARIGQEVSKIDLQTQLSDDGKEALAKLDDALSKSSLPSSLDIGLISAQGLSIGALVGLLAKKSEGVLLPLASWGTGTRRMVMLQIAASAQTQSRISVIDEVERGLEPYRVRKLLGSLEGENTQSFITTHSPVAVEAAIGSQLWYMDTNSAIGELSHKKIKAHQQRSPLTFLSKLAIVCEGLTEVGLLSVLLEKSIDGCFEDHGIYIADGEGNSTTLDLLEALSEARLSFAGIVDDEGDATARWAALKTSMGNRLLQWQDGNTEANIIGAVPEAQLEQVILDPEGDKTGDRQRHLALRLGIEDKDMASIRSALVEQELDLRTVMIAAASGNADGAPDDSARKAWKKHGQKWFKTKDGGRELAGKMITLGAWPELSLQILPVLNAVREACGQTPITDLQDAG
tara:strand:- start:1926 stop:3701 length:1776 start_codon:yes stop_codon:yes gene_type:complete